MTNELVPRVSESTSRGDTATSHTINASGSIQQIDLLHHVSLLILRSNDLQSVIPHIARRIWDACNLHTVGIMVHGAGWVIRDGHGMAILRSQVPDATIPEKHAISQSISDRNDAAAARGGIGRPSRRIDLVADRETVGFMFIREADGDRLDGETVDLLERVAEMMAAASVRVSNTNGQPSHDAGLIEVPQLLDIVSCLATLTDVDASIQPLLADIASLLNADLVSLIVSDPVQPDLFMSNEVDRLVPADEMQRLIAAPAVRLAVDSGEPQIGNIGHRLNRAGSQSHVLALPLVAGGEPTGVLVIERDGGQQFASPDREAADIVAEHMSYSLERVRHVRSYSRQNLLLSLVERVTAFIARSTDNDDLLALMAREIRRTFGYDCSIAVIVGHRLVFRALELGNPDLIPDWIEEGIPLEAGVMGRVARSGQPVFIRDVRTDTAFLDTGRETVSEIAVPIRSGGQVVGVLNVEASADNSLQDLDYEILLILASHIGIALSNRQLIASERETRMAIEAIQRVSTIVAEALDPEESLRLMAQTLAEILDYPVVSLALVEGRWLIRKANYGYDPDAYPGVMGIDEGISGRVARTGIPVLLEDVDADPDYLRQREDLTSEVCVPIRSKGEIVGLINVEGNKDRPVTERDLHLLTTFAEHAGVLLNNARVYAELSREATLDPMTEVPNLRSFQQQLHEEFKRAEREDQYLSLAVIDLDDLKVINDTHGHLVGDQVLRELARRMRRELRGDDLLARYAGDEFVAILPGVDEQRALGVGARLLKAASRAPFKGEADTPISLSLSIGVATFPVDASSSTELLRAADMAMYVAKESGKNRVSSAGQSEHIRRRTDG